MQDWEERVWTGEAFEPEPEHCVARQMSGSVLEGKSNLLT